MNLPATSQFSFRVVFILLIIILLPAVTFAKGKDTKSLIILNSGDTITGTILDLQENSIVIQTLQEGRFQFQRSDILEIFTPTPDIAEIETIDKKGNSYFAGLTELQGGYAFSKGAETGMIPTTSVMLSVGASGGKLNSAFMGIGIGYTAFLQQGHRESMTFLPIFGSMLLPLSHNEQITPFVAAKTGYNIRFSGNYGGGPLFNFQAGVQFLTGQTTIFSLSLFGKTEQISGTVVEHNTLGTFRHEGKTNIFSNGLNLSLKF